MPPIEHNGQGFAYIIKYRLHNSEGDAEEWSSMQITDWTEHAVSIPNQPSYKPYDIMVYAVNEYGLAKENIQIIRGALCPKQQKPKCQFHFCKMMPLIPVHFRMVWGGHTSTFTGQFPL